MNVSRSSRVRARVALVAATTMVGAFLIVPAASAAPVAPVQSARIIVVQGGGDGDELIRSVPSTGSVVLRRGGDELIRSVPSNPTLLGGDGDELIR